MTTTTYTSNLKMSFKTLNSCIYPCYINWWQMIFPFRNNMVIVFTDKNILQWKKIIAECFIYENNFARTLTELKKYTSRPQNISEILIIADTQQTLNVPCGVNIMWTNGVPVHWNAQMGSKKCIKYGVMYSI